jgi:hypothetical protein
MCRGYFNPYKDDPNIQICLESISPSTTSFQYAQTVLYRHIKFVKGRLCIIKDRENRIGKIEIGSEGEGEGKRDGPYSYFTLKNIPLPF